MNEIVNVEVISLITVQRWINTNISNLVTNWKGIKPDVLDRKVRLILVNYLH